MPDVKVTVAALQLTSGADEVSNIEQAFTLLTRATAQGATYIQLPEYFNYYGPTSKYGEVAQRIPGPLTDRLGEFARAHGVTLHVGSMLERTDESTRFFNTSVVIGNDGEIRATYRKVHLFDIDVPGEVSYQESRAIGASDELVTVELDAFTLGLSICFDVRFPELYRSLALRGATVLAVPSAFNARTGRAHWEVLVRARAIENLCFVIAATQAGTTAQGLSSYGHAMIVDPWGEVLAMSQHDDEGVLVASIELEQVARRRAQIATLALRRPDLYGLRVDEK
ncbi:MAG: carbon-nitrogen hydrolase family protein [Acidobacteria bacterium]|nr:carbon-nitrogen hydrolase family protein [Acidobacteriota bacterium]